MRSVTLNIPGLFGPDIAIHPDDLPDLPALNWFLTRAARQPCRAESASYQLCQLFGLTDSSGKDIPVAAISRLSDDDQPPQGVWLRADPVHVTADRDGLVLIDSNRFNLTQHDALALAAEVNRVLNSRNLTLEVPVPYRWYIQLPEPQRLTTTPVDAVVGKDILPYMPAGDDRVAWIQMLNEIQMLLHDTNVNLQREQNKQLPINSVWIWGQGSLPDMIPRKWSKVVSNDMLAKGLAMLSATPYETLPERYQDTNSNDSFSCLYATRSMQRFNYYNDLEGWLEAIIEIDKNWIAPLSSELKNNRLDQVNLQTDRMLLSMNRRSRYQFWKKKQTLHSFKSLINMQN